MATLSLGFGILHGSEQRTLLREDGYPMTGRLHLEANADYMLGPHAGVGGWGAFATSSWRSDNGGPELTQNVWFGGVNVPIVLGSSAVSFILRPKLGFANGTLGFTPHASSQTVPAYGIDLSLLSRVGHLGLTIGDLFVPAGPPGAVGRHYDLGSFNICLTGVIDG